MTAVPDAVAAGATVTGMTAAKNPVTQPILGVLEIAHMLDVKDRTVHQWLRRELLPHADYGVINGSRCWSRPVILKWAGETGRLTSKALRDEYEQTYKVKALPVRRGGRLPVDDPPLSAVKGKGPAKRKPAAKKAPAKKVSARKKANAKVKATA